MNMPVASLLCLLFFTCVNSSLYAQTNLQVDNKTAAFLEKFDSDYEQAILTHNPDLVSGYWADDVRLMPEYQKTMMGKENAELYLYAFADRFEISQYSRDKLEMLDLGSRIVEFGTFTMKATNKATGEESEMPGKYGMIWTKQEDGELRLITEAWNYNLQVDSPEQLIFDEVPIVNVALEAHVPVNNNISFELAAINRFTEDFITQHDDHLWSQLYGKNGMLMYSNHPIYSGKEEIEAFLSEHVKGLPVFEKLDIRTDRIDRLGNFVIEYSSHIAIIKNGDWSGVATGKNIVIWKREPDHSLKIFRGIAMYD